VYIFVFTLRTAPTNSINLSGSITTSLTIRKNRRKPREMIATYQQATREGSYRKINTKPASEDH
jgi:hypothetical protein